MPNWRGSSCDGTSIISSMWKGTAPRSPTPWCWRPASSCGVARRRHWLPGAGAFIPFVDPALPAPDAPFRWLPDFGAAELDAVARPLRPGEPAELILAGLRCVRHVVVLADAEEYLLFRTTAASLALRLLGASSLRHAVRVTFQVNGLAAISTTANKLLALSDLLVASPRWVKRSRRQNCLRDALIALDGHAVGATYRDIATVVTGVKPANADWSKTSRSLKDRMHRAFKACSMLRHGGYRSLIG